jgi:hypothetical protein
MRGPRRGGGMGLILCCERIGSPVPLPRNSHDQKLTRHSAFEQGAILPAAAAAIYASAQQMVSGEQDAR